MGLTLPKKVKKSQVKICFYTIQQSSKHVLEEISTNEIKTKACKIGIIIMTSIFNRIGEELSLHCYSYMTKKICIKIETDSKEVH